MPFQNKSNNFYYHSTCNTGKENQKRAANKFLIFCTTNQNTSFLTTYYFE